MPPPSTVTHRKLCSRFQLLFGDLPDRMTTPTGKMLAQERYTYMKEFFTRLRKEVEGDL